MQEVKSDIMTFRGSHFDLGIKTAQWLKQTPLLENREREWKKRIPRFDIDVNETYSIFQTYAPEIWEELLGMQEILNLPTKQMILNFGHYRFTDLNESGCTVFKVKIIWFVIMTIILLHMMADIFFINQMMVDSRK